MTVLANAPSAPAFEELPVKALAGLSFLLLLFVLADMMNSTLQWVAEYDSAGRMTWQKKQSIGGSATSRLFNYGYFQSGANTGLVQTVSDPRGVTFTNSYDGFRRLETVAATGSIPARNQTLAYSYDNRGILESVVQTGGAQPASTVARTISAYGQITDESVTVDGATTSSSQSWDGAGRRVSLNSGMGFQPMFGHNAAGQMTSVTVGGNTYNSYFTTAGLLSSRSNAFRTQTVTDRDGAGRVLTQAVTAGSATPLSETQTWLADGRLDAYSAVRVGANAWNELRDYQYNSRGQLTNEPFAPRPAGSAELTYGFDALGLRIAAMVGAGGNSNWFANATSVYTTQEIAVDSINDSLVTSSASGVAFGAARVELDVDGVPIADALHPGWADATGAWSANLTLTPGQHSLTARAVHPSGWETDPVTSTFTVNGTPQTVTNYSYDQVGNLVWRSWSGGKDQVFTWDAQGRLVNVEEYADGYLASTWTAAYDGLGRRLQTTTTPYGGATTTINSSFDPQAEFLEVGVNVNGVQNWKVHGPDLNGSFGGLNGTGGLEAVISPAGTTGTITDSFGNVVASVSGNGTVSWNFTKVGSYGPLPNSSSRTLESGATLIESSTWRNRRLDPTGYVNLGARHYDPTTGRFICPDPLGHGSSWSLYDFASGDGVNNFDADGRVASQAASAVERVYSALNPSYGEARSIDRLRAALGVERFTPVNAASQVRQADANYAANWENAYLSGGDTQAATAQYETSRNNALTGYGESLQHANALNQPAYDTLVVAGMVMTAGVGQPQSTSAKNSFVRVQHATSSEAAESIVAGKRIASETSDRLVYGIVAQKPGTVAMTQQEILGTGARYADEVVEFSVSLKELRTNDIGDAVLPSPVDLSNRSPIRLPVQP